MRLPYLRGLSSHFPDTMHVDNVLVLISRFLHRKKRGQRGQFRHHLGFPGRRPVPALTHRKHCDGPKREISLRTARDKARRRNYHSQPWKLCSVPQPKEMPNQSVCSATSCCRRHIPQGSWNKPLASLPALPGYPLWDVPHLGWAAL